MKKLLLFIVLVAPAFGQTFSGTAGSDIFIPSPFRFCMGVDGHGDDCATQSNNQEMQWTGSVDFKWAFRKVGTLPAASILNQGRTYEVTDGQSTTDCTTGGGASIAICTSDGTQWNAIGASGNNGGSGGVPSTLPNCTAAPTTLSEGVQLSTQIVNSVAQLCGTTASASSTTVVGVCTSGCGASGNAAIAYSGYANAIFDGQTVQGDYAIPSSTAGQFTDIGASKPSGTTEVVGIVAGTNTGAGTAANILIQPLSLYTPGGSNNSGNINNATQFKIPYYSNGGSSNVLSGDACTTDGSGNETCVTLRTSGSGAGTVTYGTGAPPNAPAPSNVTTYGNGVTTSTSPRAHFLDCINDSSQPCLYNTVDAFHFGAFADGTTAHTITQSDINNNTQWLGCGTVNTSGTSVTWVSGAKFYPDLNTYLETVNIGGANYAVSGIGSITAGVATSLTLGSSAGTQTGVRWCEYAVGDQWDYVSLQEAIFAALGAPGSEHSNTNAMLNKEIDIPSGSWEINKPLNITHGVGVHVKGQMRYGVTIYQNTNNTPLLVTNGFSESKIEGIFFRPSAAATATTSALVEISWDGSTTNWTQALQGDTFQDDVFSAEGAAWQIGLRMGGGGFQGSENLFLNSHWFWFTADCLVLSNANALQNTIQGGNFQNCSGDGIHVSGGSVYVHSVGFQDGNFASNPAQTGCDIDILNSSNDTDAIEDSRTESVTFICTANNPKIWVVGNHQTPSRNTWQANHGYTVSSGLLEAAPPAGSTQQIGGLFTISATCTTGASEPTWTYTTTTDGSCTWTYHNPLFVSTPTFGTVLGNSVETGSILGISAGTIGSDPHQLVILNNSFSRRDWENPNNGPPYSTPNSAFFNCMNTVFAGGGIQSGGGGAIWDNSNTPLSGKTFHGVSQCNFGTTPLLFQAGSGGASGYDVGLGASVPPNGTFGEFILAVLGTTTGGSPAGSNPRFGRLYATGTNTAATNQDIASGEGTGNSTPTLTQFYGPVATSSGTSVQNSVQRLVLNDTKQLTSGSATTLVSSTIAADQRAGGKIDYFIEATDTTNHHNCTLAGQVMYTAENTAATVVTAISAIGTPATACDGANTLTATWAQTAATPSLAQVTPTLTGFTATQFQIVYSVENYGQGQTVPTF